MPETSRLVEEQVSPSPSPEPARGAVTRRLQLVQILAFAALVAALIGALGPAKDVRSTYSWPPPTLPETMPSSAWYTPLLLLTHRPESISASVPCVLPAWLPEAERPHTILATARVPERNGGMSLTRAGEELVVRVGKDVVARADFPADGATGECVYRLRLVNNRLSLAVPSGDEQSSALASMPVVSGLFSALDLQSGTPPTIEVTSAVHATHPRPHQSLASALAVVCMLAALLLVALERRPRPWNAVVSAVRQAATHPHPVDALVAIALLGWWVIAPAFDDDGSVIASERTFSSSGGFTSYYNAFGTNYPNVYWLEWAQHWLVDATSALLWLRVPSLLCLAAVWILCRWILSRVLASSPNVSGVVLWALSSVFLVGVFAWGMTLGPEPVSALFVTAIFACVVRFLERGTAAPLALLAMLLPFAITGHHRVSIVALAPLLVVSPTLLRWARARIPVASTIVASGIALLAVLLFLGSDLEQRRSDAGTLATHTGVSWRSEILRYEALENFPFATPLRRGSVALIGLAVLAFLLRRRRGRQPLLDLPASSLGVSLLLLIATPSKLPWHFGALLGVAALAAAAETARLRGDAATSRGFELRPFVVIGAAIYAATWSWSRRGAWSTVDLRTYDWAPEAKLAEVGLALPLVLLGGSLLAAALSRNRERLRQVPWRVGSWTAALLGFPMLVLTVAVLGADAARTAEWTLTRQNLGALRGDVGCGLGDDVLVPVPASMRPLQAIDASVAGRVPQAPVAALPRFALGPTGAGSASSPWFDVRGQERFGIYIAGTPRAPDHMELQWGRLGGGNVQTLQSEEFPRGVFFEAGATLPWRFVAASELPTQPRGADAVRIRLRGDIGASAAVVVTSPVTYGNEPLSRRLAAAGARPLISPNLVTYFPCAVFPRFAAGAAEVPSQVLVPANAPSPIGESATSPFAGLLDLYRLERLPLADSPNPPERFVAFDVDRIIVGAAEAIPTVTTSTTG